MLFRSDEWNEFTDPGTQYKLVLRHVLRENGRPQMVDFDRQKFEAHPSLDGWDYQANLVTRARGTAVFTEAVYTQVILKPKEQLALREGQRVRLIGEPLDDDAAPE